MAKQRFITKSAAVLPVFALLLASCAGGGGTVDLASEAATTSSVAVAQEATTSTTASPAPVTTRGAVTRSTSAPPARRSGDTGPAPIDYDPNAPREPDVQTSPLKIPPITVAAGQPIATIMQQLVASIIKECGTPTPCVTIVTEQDATIDLSFCQFYKTVPSFENTLVPRNSTVKVVVGSRPPKVGPPCTASYEGSQPA